MPTAYPAAGDNYGEARVGYKGSALSTASALTGDRSTQTGGGASVASGTQFGGSFGGAAAPSSYDGLGGPTGSSYPTASSSPTTQTTAVVVDAGVFPAWDGGALDAGISGDAAAVAQDAARDAQDAPEAAAEVDPLDAGSTSTTDAALDAAADATAALDGATPTDVAPPLDAALATIDAARATVDASVEVTATVHDAGALASAEEGSASADVVPENPFFNTSDEARATFAIDVDTGSYTLARASINAGHLPDPESVRIEEFLNYFHFHYAQPEPEKPFAVYTESGPCPWNPEHKLLLVGIQGQEVTLREQPPANLVFLFDVSGSMDQPNKLPLLKKGFRMLASQLRAQDRVAIVTYAGREAVALPSTPGDQKDVILAAIDRVEAGGSTNGEGGIQKAYEIALQNVAPGSNNRVLLATDGDFNVGLRGTEQLVPFIAQKRDTGVYLSVYGFGSAWDGGNYQDAVGEQLADNGDGIYFYVDSPEEARRAFLESVSGSLLTVAKDVKVQVEFNPEWVKGYRLVGYENRVLANSAFSDDAVDGGELGAGLSVTALFEWIPVDSADAVPEAAPGSIPERAAEANADTSASETFEPLTGDDLLAVRLRYKTRADVPSTLLELRYDGPALSERMSPKFLFAAGVSELAMQLRHSQYLPSQRREALFEQLAQALPLDAEGAVEELLRLAKRAAALE